MQSLSRNETISLRYLVRRTCKEEGIKQGSLHKVQAFGLQERGEDWLKHAMSRRARCLSIKTAQELFIRLIVTGNSAGWKRVGFYTWALLQSRRRDLFGDVRSRAAIFVPHGEASKATTDLKRRLSSAIGGKKWPAIEEKVSEVLRNYFGAYGALSSRVQDTLDFDVERLRPGLTTEWARALRTMEKLPW